MKKATSSVNMQRRKMIKNANKSRKAVMVLLLAAVMVISFLFSNDMTTVSFADGADVSGKCGDSAT